ncbi:GH25 family lysozyme [Actinoplanes sp. NPDC049548]|uniref:GH25 family lysozyme n=1 Tax=Actinoplanes sp. NPDC049548 TaxID=3155152 RepID=UPI0034131278
MTRTRLFTGSVAAALAATFCVGTALDASAGVTDTRPRGVDVSSYQAGFDWTGATANGISFAYVKATEGTTYRNPRFAEQYNGSYRAGMIRGSYHYARPDRAGGAAQAEFFVANGGGWSRDGRTLPGALDLESSGGVDFCYGKTQDGMRAWIHDFVNRYRELTGRWAVIYTRATWWNPCTGGDSSIAANSPLWLAHPGAAPGPVPAGWPTYSFWQRGLWNGVDLNTWNGSAGQLRVMACDGPC